MKTGCLPKKTIVFAFFQVCLFFLVVFTGHFQEITGSYSFLAHLKLPMKMDAQTVTSELDCAIPQLKSNLLNQRLKKERLVNFFVNFIQKNDLKTTSVVAFDFQDTFQKHSSEFLMRSILRAKHHPPTFV